MATARTFQNRRKAALKFFQKIPASRVNLRTFGCKNNQIDASGRPLNFTETISVRNGRGWQHEFACGAVGCLAGWLWTWPAYLRWCKQEKIERVLDIYNLEGYLGVSDPFNDLFSDRTSLEDYELSDKQIAVRRLKSIIGRNAI